MLFLSIYYLVDLVVRGFYLWWTGWVAQEDSNNEKNGTYNIHAYNLKTTEPNFFPLTIPNKPLNQEYPYYLSVYRPST